MSLSGITTHAPVQNRLSLTEALCGLKHFAQACRPMSEMPRGATSRLALGHAVLRGILRATNADIEGARCKQRTLRLGALLDAEGLGFQFLALVAVGVWRRCRRGLVVEDALCWRDLACTRHDLLCGIIVGIAVEVAARTILASGPWAHGDLHIDVVGPAHHLQVHAQGRINVHDVLDQMALGGIHELPLAIVVHRGHARHSTGRWEACALRLPVDEDLAILHWTHNDGVALHEGPS